PEPMACAQLLRDPFSIAVAAPRALGTGSGIRSLVFNPTGNKLWARTEQGRIIMIPVPNSPREKVGKPKEFETLGSFPVAIGRSARTTVLVSIDPATRTLTLARFGRRRNAFREGAYSFVEPDINPVFQSDRLSLCAWHSIAGRKEGFYLLDDAGSLLRLFLDADGQRWCDLVHPYVLALTLAQSGMCYAAYDPTGGGEVRVYLNDHNVPVQSWPSSAAPTRAFLGYATPPFAPSMGLVALEYANSQWEICVGQSHIPVAVPGSFSVHGVVR